MRKFLNLKMVPSNLGGLGVFRHAYKVLGRNFEFRPSLKPKNKKKKIEKNWLNWPFSAALREG